MDLPLSKRWTKCIKENDATTVQDILDNSNTEERNWLLNGEHFPETKLPYRNTKYKHLQVSRSLPLAVAHNARDVVVIMLNFCADITVTERGGNNTVHVLAQLCDLSRESEDTVVDYYQWLMGLLSKDEKRTLLLVENDEGLRPLEVAAQKGHLKLFRAIFETSQVYMLREEELGIFTVRSFDITDYEGGNAPRNDKSPLAFIGLMSTTSFESPRVKNIFEWEPLSQWYDLKSSSCTVFLIIWILARFLYLLCYYIVIYSQPTGSRVEAFVNGSSSNASRERCEADWRISLSWSTIYALAVYIALNSCIIFLVDILELIYVVVFRRPYVFYKNALCGTTVVSVYFYRVIQHLLVWIFGVYSIILLANPASPRVRTAKQVIEISAAFGTFACILNFLQLAPYIGHYVLTVHRMMNDLLFFLIMYLFCLLPLAYFFLIFFSENTPATDCDHDFSSFWESMYTSFLMMLNMVNLRSFNVENQEILLIVHVIFVFIVAVLLLNFLIAVMSSTAAEICEKKMTAQRLERLQMYLVAEFRTRWLIPRYYGYMARKLGFVRHGKVMVTDMVWKPSDPR